MSDDDFSDLDGILGGLSEWGGDPYESEEACARLLPKVSSIVGAGEHNTDSDDPSTVPENAASGIVGPYEVLEKLGQGGMGRVYKARHRRLGRVVAIKILHRGDRRSTMAGKRFRREMKALGRIQHPNIVSATDGGVRDGIHFLAMEFIDGVNLAQLLRHHGKLSVAAACELCRQTAVGLHAALAAGLVHRDIKPSNLMLTASSAGEPTLKICDLGLASFIDQAEREDELTLTGQIVGTLEFMSPEQKLNSRDVGHATDVYSLAATFCKLVGADAEFKPQPDQLLTEQASDSTEKTQPSISSRLPDLPSDLSALIDEMLCFSPSERLNDFEKMIATFGKYASGNRLAELLVQCPRPLAKESLGSSELRFLDADRLGLPIETESGLLPRRPSFFHRHPSVLGGLACLAIVAFSLVATAFWMGVWNREHSPVQELVERGDNDEPERGTASLDPLHWNIASNLVAYWPIEITDELQLRDHSGNGMHLSMPPSNAILADVLLADAGAPVPRTTACMVVTDIEESFQLPKKRVKIETELTVAFWIKAGGNRKNTVRLLKEGEPDSEDEAASGFEVGLKKSRDGQWSSVYVYFENGAQSIDAQSAPVFNFTWHHFTATINDRELRIYVDGKLNQSTALDSPLGSTTLPLLIGDTTTHNAKFRSRKPKVLLDEILLYDRALREDEIRILTTNVISPRPVTAPLSTVTDAKTAKSQIKRSIDVSESQRCWALFVDQPLVHSNSVDMSLLLIPPGEFLMGSDQTVLEELYQWDNRRDKRERYGPETPQHFVRIASPFYFGKTEVTQQQFQKVMGRNPSFFRYGTKGAKKLPSLAKTPVEKKNEEQTRNYPVETITWYDAIEFCNRLSQLESLPPYYVVTGTEVTALGGGGYRLPTEAEWEYACRAGTNGKWSYPDKAFRKFEWVTVTANERTHPVAQLSPNPFGLHDMHGNVFEWCFDWFDTAEYARRDTTSTIDPSGPPSGTRRVYRGGSWWQRRLSSRSAFRGHHFPNFKMKEHGFRVARTLVPKEE